MVAPRGHHATSSGGGRGHGGLDRPLLAGAGPSSQVSVTSGPAYMSLQPHNLVTLAPVTLRTVPAHLAVARPPGRQLAGCWAEGVEGAELRAAGGAKTPVTQPRPGLVPVPSHVTAAGGLVGPGALVPPVPRGAFARTWASARPAPCLRSGTCPANSCGLGPPHPRNTRCPWSPSKATPNPCVRLLRSRHADGVRSGRVCSTSPRSVSFPCPQRPANQVPATHGAIALPPGAPHGRMPTHPGCARPLSRERLPSMLTSQVWGPPGREGQEAGPDTSGLSSSALGLRLTGGSMWPQREAGSLAAFLSVEFASAPRFILILWL